MDNMNISFNPSFTSRNKNIKKADDIQRRVRLTFPATSPTFIDTFYKTTNSLDEERQEQANFVAYRYDKKISAVREQVRRHSYEGTTLEEKNMNAPIFQILRCVGIAKAANCQEYAAIATAGLAANGIFDNQRVNLKLEVKYINKENGRIEYQGYIQIDHTAIKTWIGKDSVIVDAWLGFADSLSGAREKYKKIFIDENIEQEIKKHSSLFKLEKSRRGDVVDPDKDYELKTSIIYAPVEFPIKKDMEKIGYYSRRFYPELIL